MMPPSPKYILRSSFSGQWYVIPFIYEYMWDQWNKYEGKPKVAPQWARPVKPDQLVFEQPEMLPR